MKDASLSRKSGEDRTIVLVPGRVGMLNSLVVRLEQGAARPKLHDSTSGYPNLAIAPLVMLLLALAALRLVQREQHQMSRIFERSVASNSA